MAKSKLSSSLFSLEDVDSLCKKLKGFEGRASSIPPVREWLHTGNYLLNAQLSGSLFGGAPRNRITTFAGQSGSGKTFIALNLMRAASQQGYIVYYFDTEGAVETPTLEAFGINPDMVFPFPIDNILDTKSNLNIILRQYEENVENGIENPKTLVVIDSLSKLNSQKGLDDALVGKSTRDMTPQQELVSLFNTITRRLANLSIPCIVTAHAYKNNMDPYASEKWVVKGGIGPEYASSSIVLLTKKADRSDKTGEKVGIIVTSDLLKSRSTRYHKIVFGINFSKGMNPYIGLQNYVDWDTCGIGHGKLMPVTREEPVIDEKTNLQKIRAGNLVTRTVETGEYEFVPYESGTKGKDIFAVQHLGKNVSLNELLQSNVFTQEILERLDKKIQKTFKFGSDQDDALEIEIEKLEQHEFTYD